MESNTDKLPTRNATLLDIPIFFAMENRHGGSKQPKNAGTVPTTNTNVSQTHTRKPTHTDPPATLRRIMYLQLSAYTS
jgi:hypothetical protein